MLVVRKSPPLRGTIRVPGDKSISHRALLFGALCQGDVVIEGLGSGGDNTSTAAALEALGVAIDRSGERVVVHGRGFAGLRAAPGPIDCGNAGTTMRLLAGLLAGRPFSSRLVGDDSLTRRPMKRVAAPLRLMGASVEGRSDPLRPADVYPPLEIRGGALRGIDCDLPVASAQLKSALVLAGLQAQGTTRIREPALSRDHTERMLGFLGAPITVSGLETRVEGGWAGGRAPGPVVVPGDLSSAAFFIVAAAGTEGADVTVEDVGINPTRSGVIDALRAMGADIAVEQSGEAMGEPRGRVRVRGSKLRGTEIRGSLALRAIDEIPALAVAAALAEASTTFDDLAELRIKESDRIAAICRELRRAGVEGEERPSGFRVDGVRGDGLRGGLVTPEGDHRMAMAMAILGLGADEPTLVPDEHIATSFPGFAETLRALGGRTD